MKIYQNMMKTSVRMAMLLFFGALFMASCQDSPTSVNNEQESKSPVIKSEMPVAAKMASGQSVPLVMLDAGASHVTAYFPGEGNYISWSDGKYPERTNYGLYEDEQLDGSVLDFKAGAYTNCVLNDDGTTTCTGYLADELSYDGSFGRAVSFDVGYGMSCVVNESNEVICSGYYLVGSTNWSVIYSDEGENFFEYTGAVEWLTMSDYAVCLKTEGADALKCRGWNVREPNWEVQGTPTSKGEGSYAMCILTEEGNVDCMNSAYNDVGQTAGYYGGDAIAFDANFDQACYVKENGDIGCFGRNLYDGTMSITGVNAMDVSVSGNNDICYATADGDITCTRSTPDDYNGSGTSGNVYISDASVTTWDPIFPATVDGNWPTTVCYQDNTFGLEANWVNPHNAFEVGTHPWEGINGKTWEANWINSYNSMSSTGPGGHNWSKYETTVSGEGEFVVQLLADNCSWVYLDGELVGYQSPADVSDPEGGRYGVTLNGESTLSFVIFDGGGLAGGKFRLETTESYGGPTPPPIQPTNEAPVANAGADQTMDATGQTTPVSLDGSASSDADGDALSYSWSLDGTEVSTSAAFTTDLADGSYTFTLTVSDGEESDSDEVSVTVVNTVPVADAGLDITTEATGPTTSVTLNGSGMDADGDALTYSWSNGSSAAVTEANLGVGTHIFTLTVTDGQGASSSDEVTVKVEDTTAPELMYSTETNSLWPPNHKMVLVMTGISATDIADESVTVDVAVSSNESTNGKGDGNTDSDCDIVLMPDGSYDVYLRAERSGKGKGRTYTVTVSSEDASGNMSRETVSVNVAKSQGKGSTKK